MAVSDPEFRQTTSGAHGSANRADCLPRGKPFGAPAGARLFPCRGTDAPTPAREQSLQPYGAFTLFFRWRKKSVQKKASGTATLAARPAMRNSQISAFRALPCPALVFAQACQSLTAFGSCAYWAHAPSRPKLRSAVAPSGLSSTLVRFAHPSGKKASIAHFAGGARHVARNLVGQITPTLMRAPVLAFFRRQNGRAFFPSLPIAALLRRRLGGRRN